MGFSQGVSVNVTHPDIPFNSRIYETGKLHMPSRAFFKGVQMKTSGKVWYNMTQMECDAIMLKE